MSKKKTITTGSDFSGVGAFDYAIERVLKVKGFDHRRVFACDMDKFARQSYIANHGEPKYYPENVYDRTIPDEPIDIYMTSPPCQSFSLAGKRKGKSDERGVLFFNSYEFIKENKPRFFIFENVKGLLSDDKGRTFQEWLNYLGGKSINGLPILFKDGNAVDYHVYWKVLNSKKHGVPQNRERVFIIGIRDDEDNSFQFPKEEPLTTRLKDVIEKEVDTKYFLSDKAMSCLSATDYKQPKQVIQLNTSKESQGNIRVTSGTKRGFDIAEPGDSINFERANSKTRKGRVGKKVAQTLDTVMQQTYYDGYSIRRLTPRECFRLQDFPESFNFVVSDSQLYKQAGNSITVRVLELILFKLDKL